MRIYNTLSGQVENFISQQKGIVKMYVCGITPYDEVHLGHARCYVIFDLIRRYLENKGYEVFYVQNFTDIDDKIIDKAKQLKMSIFELSNIYINSYFDSETKLNIKKANFYPKVTQHIDDIISSIEILLNKGFAYVTESGIYFDITKFNSYGQLSKKRIEDLITGIRIEIDETKKSPLDFALWKFKSDDDIVWETPWGKGRPGWHIECSVMSMKYLGPTLDIHGGGIDLIFPHHENEIAQSQSITDKKFVNYWVHNGFVTVNKQKMSKSLKNIFSLKEIFEQFDPMVVRLFLISQHYKNPLDFSIDELNQFKSIYDKIINVAQYIEQKIKTLNEKNFFSSKIIDETQNIVKEFDSAIQNDLNTSLALSYIHKFISFIYKADFVNKKDLVYCYEKFLNLLNILGIKLSFDQDIPQEIKDLVLKREIARKNKDFIIADSLRKKILDLGYFIEDTKDGPRIKKL